MRNVGGYAGWRWIFILVSNPALFGLPRLTILQEGLLTIVIAIIAYWFISNYPDTVTWLNKEERAFIQARLKADSDATNDEAFSWSEVAVAAKDIKIWLYAAAFHTMSLPLYTLSLFLVSSSQLLFFSLHSRKKLTYPANNHPRHGLHSSTVPTPNHPSLRSSNHLHNRLGHTLGTLFPPCPLHHYYFCRRDHRVRHLAREHQPESAPGRVLPRYLLRSNRYLPLRRLSTMLARNQCLRSDKARDGKRYADQYRQLRRCVGHAVVSLKFWTEICTWA